MITGGSQGLGLELVRCWVDRPDCDSVVVLDVYRSKELAMIEESPRTKVSFMLCDLSDEESTDAAFKELNSFNVDILICNSGIRQRRPFSELTKEEVSQIMRVNFLSQAELIRQVLEKKSSKLHIVGISSVLGFIGPKNLGIYSSSKSSTIDLLEALRNEVDDSVAITTIAPGQLDTEMFNDKDVPDKFLAPKVNHVKLAGRITELIEDSANGLYVYPLYGRYLPVMRALPYCIYRMLRTYSGMDNV